MLVNWIGGWGVMPERMRPWTEGFPDGAKHVLSPPSRAAAEAAAGGDRVIGWSLGALRILDAAAQGVRYRGRVWLLAPFADFCHEHGPGGRCSLTQVRWLRRWLERDPQAALQDFYLRAGLTPPPTALPYAAAELLEGLDRLAEPAGPELRRFASAGLPAGWLGFVGACDPLLDASMICQVLPGCRIVAGARHQAEPLLTAARELDCAL